MFPFFAIWCWCIHNSTGTEMLFAKYLFTSSFAFLYAHPRTCAIKWERTFWFWELRLCHCESLSGNFLLILWFIANLKSTRRSLSRYGVYKCKTCNQMSCTWNKYMYEVIAWNVRWLRPSFWISMALFYCCFFLFFLNADFFLLSFEWYFLLKSFN